MKRFITILLTLIVTASVFLPQQASAQSPQKMSYQAVIRNSSNALVTNTNVGMQISILQGSQTGSAVYIERQFPTTNINGLVTIEIGSGTVVSGSFAGINWANGPFFVKAETDLNGGAAYTVSGTSELLSVPFALFSANGTPGPQGPIGLTGPQGPAGNNGAIGATGATGAQGPIGLTGPQGSAGNNGAAGATGAMGLQGIQGMPGTNGTNGTNGISLIWKGNLATAPASPVINWAYYNIVNLRSYIFDGSAWTILTQDGIGGVTTAGTNITITGAGTTVSPYVINASGVTNGSASGQMQYWNGTSWVIVASGQNGQILTYKNGVPTWSDGSINDLAIGDYYKGGIIAYFLKSGDAGYDANMRHGLIIATTDQGLHNTWYNGIYTITGATGSAIGTGSANTTAIIANQGNTGTYAAKICRDYTGGGYNDWYLPSRDELYEISLNKVAIGGFALALYWTSTETYDYGFAYLQGFDAGFHDGQDKRNSHYVRAVRNF